MLGTSRKRHAAAAGAVLARMVCPRAAHATRSPAPGDAGRAVSPLQEPVPDARPALPRAMVVLKIAPYLSVEDRSDDDSERPCAIAVVGDDPAAAAMRRHLPKKRIGDRAVEVVAVTPAELVEPGDRPCFDVVYVARSVGDDEVSELIRALRERPATLICERPGFAAAGGGIQLFVRDNAIRFEVNADALKRQGVRASPHLLKLSKRGPRS